jgi:hypothetical protein
MAHILPMLRHGISMRIALDLAALLLRPMLPNQKTLAGMLGTALPCQSTKSLRDSLPHGGPGRERYPQEEIGR